MTSSAGKLTTKAIAVIVIVAMLGAVGLSPVIMVFFFGVIMVVWVVARHSQAREVERIFDFYVAADAILREEERRWYGFEIAEVIEQGESLLETLPDAPPLNYFVLGALYMLWFAQRFLFGIVKAPHQEAIADLGFRERAILATIVVAIFALGLYPQEALRKTELAAREYQLLAGTTRTPSFAQVPQASAVDGAAKVPQ